MSSSNPLVSLILVVRNGLPYVREAVESVKALSYDNYELVIQDGASTDGTAEYLRGVDGLPAVRFESARDSGIGQGYNRALSRCRGAIVGSIDADNLMETTALEKVVKHFTEHQDAAVVYGACNMIAPDGAFLHTWVPPEFDMLGLLEGTVVPPFSTSFFSTDRCGDDLGFDEDFPTVADFDLWLRLCHHRIDRITDVLGAVRIGPQSSTWNPDNYEQQCRYKIHALRRFLQGPRREFVVDKLLERAQAGIHLWGLESMAMISGGQHLKDQHFEEAARGDIESDRFRHIVARARPRVGAARRELRQRLLDCGVEYLKNQRLAEARVYLELLADSGDIDPQLSSLLAAAGSERITQSKGSR